MDLMDAIYTRRSVRKYLPTPVSRTDLEALLEAACQAPTGMNRQPWAFGVVEGVEALRTLGRRAKADLLAGITDDSPLVGYRERLASPDFHIFYDAPALVVIFARPDGVTAKIDTCLAAGNLMLAAHGLGLGTCWIGFSHGFLDKPEFKAEFGVPESYTLAAPIVVGRPDGVVPTPVKADPQVLFWQ